MKLPYQSLDNRPITALDAPSLVFFALAGTYSLRPSLGATLRAAVAVQIVCPDDLSLNQMNNYAFGRERPLTHKSARSRFGHPKDALCAMEGAHQNPARSSHQLVRYAG